MKLENNKDKLKFRESVNKD